MTSKNLLDNMSELTSKAINLYRQGWTYENLVETLKERGNELTEGSMTALKVAWAVFQVESPNYDEILYQADYR